VHRLSATDIASESGSSSRSAGRGFMLSGSEDRKIRLWDLGRVERTSVLSGLESEQERPSFRYVLILPFMQYSNQSQHPTRNTWLEVDIRGDLAQSFGHLQQSPYSANVLDHSQSAEFVEISSGCDHSLSLHRLTIPRGVNQWGCLWRFEGMACRGNGRLVI
jgi:hypothetical protein